MYWEGGKEIDVTGAEMVMPDGMVIPQLVGDEAYKYLGTEMRTGWADGKGQDEVRQKVVRKCRQMIGLIGRMPMLTSHQMSRAISLAVAGTIGYYGRSSVITWSDCASIEIISPAVHHIARRSNVRRACARRACARRARPSHARVADARALAPAPQPPSAA